MVRQYLSRWRGALTRRGDGPRPSAGDITLVAIFRNELDYALEWLAYHRSVGFRSFIIGDNNSDDGTSELLEALHECGVIERRHAPDAIGTPTQVAFYNAVVETLRAGPDRLLGFIDADEFVMAASPGRVADRVAALFRAPDVGAVGVNWKIYGSSGFVRDGVGPVLLRFAGHADRSFEKNRFIKSFARLSCIRRMDVHNALLDSGRYVDGSGAPLELEQAGWRHRTRDVNWSNLFVGHYIVKSRQEHERNKARKGSATRGARIRKGAGYVRAHDRNDRCRVQPEGLLRRMFSEQQALLLRLRSGSPYFLPCRGTARIDRSRREITGWVAVPAPLSDGLRIIMRSPHHERVMPAEAQGLRRSGGGSSSEHRYGFRLSLAGFERCPAEDLELRAYGSCARLTVEEDRAPPA